MDWIESFINEYGVWLGAAAFFVAGFERIARITPTTTDDAVVGVLYRIFSVLGVKVPDNPGKAQDGG
ncbi:MAG: hypothetical protein ACE5H8_02225 [Alphaproteobacteria bacterium]